MDNPLVYMDEVTEGNANDGYYQTRYEFINQEKFDVLLHNTIRQIIRKGRTDLAQLLIKSQIIVNREECLANAEFYTMYHVEIHTPQEYFELLKKEDKKFIREIISVIISSLSQQERGDFIEWDLTFTTKLIIPEKNWREELDREISLKRVINNQGGINNSDKVIYYNYLKYRSPAEVEITKELSKYDVLYFPLPVAVVKGTKKEPDFLIQHPKTKVFGILEIHGDTYHTPSNSQQDHERAEIFTTKGIYVKFVSAKKCMEEPKEVLRQFFEELKNF